MSIEQLKLLEEKVNKAMGLITKLKEKSEELESRNSALEVKLKEKEKALGKIAKESESLNGLKEENEVLKQDKETMYSKVSEILAHLEEIEG